MGCLSQLILFFLLLSSGLLARAQDWSRGAAIPPDGRSNPYGISASELPGTIRNGRLDALHYPVSVTGILLPYRPISEFVSAKTANPLRYVLEKFISGLDQFSSMDEVEAWVGLQPYPSQEGTGVYEVPFPNEQRPSDRMGLTLVQTPHALGFTVSCAECHAGNLFGREIIGLTNRFPRANAVFVRSKEILPYVSRGIFQFSTGASDAEADLFEKSKEAMSFVGAKMPAQLGLDTSLAQVALSLAKRAKDPWASKIANQPDRSDPVAEMDPDSKPAVWWNLKYKNRWLSDGSIVSGNPIFTNFIWNEIGRGTDLRALQTWLAQNESVVRDLTTAVFSTQPPLWTDFFPATSIDETKARRGEQLFAQHCAHCHGTYTKAWSESGSENLSLIDRLKTIHVTYPNLVVNVGTDPTRAQGMRSLEQLNDLEISQRNGIVVEAQKGYMPPPLVGIWARWPYFHNNSAPTLCAVLTRASERPTMYWAREANDPKRDFDSACVGYPKDAPSPFTSTEYRYDTTRPGMHASGHDERIFLKNGRELFTADDKMAIIEFLKTL